MRTERIDNRSMMSRIKGGGRNDNIQILRFFSALAVSLFHVGFLDSLGRDYNVWLVNGVYIFYAISGYVTMFSTERGCDEFMSKRLIRIFPLYWFLTFATFAAMKAVPSVFPYNPTIVELLKSLFLIPYGHHATATANAMYPIVSMGHTIQTTMFYYLIFLIAGKLSYRKRGLLSAFFIMVIVICGYIFKPSSPFLKFYMRPDLIYFISGITAYHVCKLRVMDKNKFVKVAATFSIILFVTTMCFHNKWILAILILWLLCATVFSKKPQGVCCGIYKRLASMGNWTFSYFLIHLYIVRFAEVFGGTQFCLNALLCDLAAIVIAWGISYVSYELIESHLTNILKLKLLNSKYV